MINYDFRELNREYEVAIFNQGSIEDEDQLREYFASRGIDPSDMPVELQVWREGTILVSNQPASSTWINIGVASLYVDVLADGTHIAPSSDPNSRTAEILTWLKQNCKGQYLVRCDSEPDGGDDMVGFEAMLLDSNDLMRFKLSFTGYI